MAKCKICGKRFDKEEAEERFCIEFPIYDYNNFNTTLCGDCAIEVIEDLEDGYYYETCECCGKKFDLITEASAFETTHDGTTLIDWWDEFGIVCYDCADDKVDEYFREREAELGFEMD